MGYYVNTKNLVITLNIQIHHPGRKEDFEYVNDLVEINLQKLKSDLETVLRERFSNYGTVKFDTIKVLDTDSTTVEH